MRFYNVQELIISVLWTINLLIGIVAALALIYFFWGLAKFILHAGGDDEARVAGKQVMLWGIIALFVMVSIWGIVNFLGRAFGVGGYFCHWC